MRVLHVIPSVSELSGGPAQAIFPMCRTLLEQGIETVIASTDHGLTHASRAPVADMKQFSSVVFHAQWGNSFKYSRPLSQWLDANVCKFDVVHIHAVFNHSSLAAARSCRKHGVPYVVRPLGTLSPWGMNKKALRKRAFWQLAGKRMMQRAAAIHYTARAEKEATEQSLKLNHGRVIPLGVEIRTDNASLQRSCLAKEFPGVGSSPYVLVLSRLHPKKGLDVFLEAFLSVIRNDEFRDWKLVLAGEGPEHYLRLLRRKVDARRGSERVIFTGWLKGNVKNAALQCASLLALPSYHENFGLCVMEALACGVPVLISPYVGLTDEIRRANAGWIAAVEPSALEQSLETILRSPDERAGRGLNGKELATNFTWSQIAQQLSDLYEEVLITTA